MNFFEWLTRLPTFYTVETVCTNCCTNTLLEIPYGIDSVTFMDSKDMKKCEHCGTKKLQRIN